MTTDEELKTRLIALMLSLRDALQAPDADLIQVLDNHRAAFDRLQRDCAQGFHQPMEENDRGARA